MSPKRTIITLAALAILIAAPTTARAGDFLDTRVTFTLGDDNFLADAGKTMVDSPLFGFGNHLGDPIRTGNDRLHAALAHHLRGHRIADQRGIDVSLGQLSRNADDVICPTIFTVRLRISKRKCSLFH